MKTPFSDLGRIEAIPAEPGHGPFLLGDIITDTDTRSFTSSVIWFDVLLSQLSALHIKYDLTQ